MSDKLKVKNFFQGLSQPGFIPKGEIIIEDDFYKQQGYENLKDYLYAINADIACLKTNDAVFWGQQSFDEFYTFVFVPGPLGGFWAQAQEIDFVATFIKNPGFAKDFIWAHLKSVLIPINKALNKGCEGILFADDIAGKNGPLISPSFLRIIYFPLLTKFVFDLHKNGFKGPILFHSDGNLEVFLDDIKNAGFDGIQCLEPSVGMNTAIFDKEEYRDWFFWGNFQYENGENMKSLAEIEAELPDLLQKWQGKNYIFGSSGGLYPGIPGDSVKTAYSYIDHK